MQIKRCFKLTNFVGANNELERALSEMNHDKINKMLLTKNWDYFKFNERSFSESHGWWLGATDTINMERACYSDTSSR